jgi:Zn-dependent protease with chaperone function
MATDFFQRQDQARRETGKLLLYLGLAVLAITALIYALVVGLLVWVEGWQQIGATAWHPILLSAVFAVVLLVVGGGAAVQAAQLSGGGRAVAEMVGGRLVPSNTHDLAQRRLLNVVEEMALASGVPVPPVYVLEQEAGINAFAAGHAPADAVVAVSQGALDYLTRDELQGVVAHEFSHILNGDMRLNLRLIALLHGLVGLSILGALVMEFVARGGASSSKKDEKNVGGAIFLFGLGVYLLGLLGVFLSELIKAAVSRQREYLADASAVQFTRNPLGIAGALKKIGGLEKGGTIKNARAIELDHMLLADPRASGLSSLMDTHPPLEERVRRLDPQWDGKWPRVRRLGEEAAETPAPKPARARRVPGAAGMPSVPGMPNVPGLPAAVVLGAGAAIERAGQVTPEQVEDAAALAGSIPEALREAAREPFGARALVYALLLSPRPDVRAAQQSGLDADGAADAAETRRLLGLLPDLPEDARLPLVDLAYPALRQLSPAQYRKFRARVEALITADAEVSLFEYALSCVLLRRLDVALGLEKAPGVRYRKAEALAPRLAVLLSRVAWEGQDDPQAAAHAFDAGLRAYLGENREYRLLPQAECSLADFDGALQAFREATPEIKRRALTACAACVMADAKVTLRESEILRAVGATLGCPLPPLPPPVAV